MAKTPASTGDETPGPLADTGHAGLARLRELEGLLATACQVRRLAETEIREGRNLERAEQRRDAAARMQRKVERELLKLRSELAGEHPEVNQVWTPGDPVGRKPRPRPGAEPEPAAEPQDASEATAASGDFELAVMLGTRRSRWETSTSDFSIDKQTPPTGAGPDRPAAGRRDRAAVSSRPPLRRASAKPTGGHGRLLALAAISAMAGAGLTYLLTQTPVTLSAIGNFWLQTAARLLN